MIYKIHNIFFLMSISVTPKCSSVQHVQAMSLRVICSSLISACLTLAVIRTLAIFAGNIRPYCRAHSLATPKLYWTVDEDTHYLGTAWNTDFCDGSKIIETIDALIIFLFLGPYGFQPRAEWATLPK